MRSIRISEQSVVQALEAADAEVRRLWSVTDPDLRALHRGRVEGAVDAMLTLGVISEHQARGLRSSIGTAIEHATS
jgi:hypothetical protein